MGRNYSFDMWVPRERLFEALSAVARHTDDELAPLMWPDGRRLPIVGTRRENDQRDLIPFDGSLEDGDGFCLSLWFEMDDALQKYHEEDMARSQEHDIPVIFPVDGHYSVGCIYLYVDKRISSLEWLDGVGEFVRIDFTAATSRMSDLFAESTSIQDWFIELAREAGALSCELNYEMASQLLFWEGERISAEDGWPESFDPDDEGLDYSLWSTYQARHPKNEDVQKMLLCKRFNEEASAHERVEVGLCLQDGNSGVRAKALYALVEVDNADAVEILENATYDADWRVRALAARLCGYYQVRGGFQILERMARARDEHPEVRIAAVLELWRFPEAFEVLSDIVLSMPTSPFELGVIKAALEGITSTEFMPRAQEIREIVAARADFPFKKRATEKFITLKDLF